MIAVVDYKKGNLKSVERGLVSAGGEAFITSDPERIAQADAIVLPGVGAFADAAETMESLGQIEVIRNRVAQGVPFLGICLGLHLMFEEGTEGAPEEDDEASSHNAKGLAILPGVVDRMPRTDADGNAYKIPHVGWNSLDFEKGKCPLFEGLEPGEYFYFTHSFIAPDSPATVATATHSVKFAAAVQYGDVAFGVQFHPEKSSDAGATVLRNFVNLVKGE